VLRWCASKGILGEALEEHSSWNNTIDGKRLDLTLVEKTGTKDALSAAPVPPIATESCGCAAPKTHSPLIT